MTHPEPSFDPENPFYDLSVIVPCTPTDTTLQEVLQSLSAQKGVNFEVLLVMNPKSGPFPALPSMNSLNIRFLGSDRGANRARNKGLAESRAELVLFLDSDCVLPQADFLFHVVHRMRSQSFLTAAGGSYQLPEGSGAGERAYNSLQMRWLQRGIVNSNFETRHLLGGFLAMRKSLLKSYVFDENLIFGGTERELLRRLHQDGHSIRLWPDLSLIHLGPITPRGLARKAFAQGQGARYILEKLGPEAPLTQIFLDSHRPDPKEDPWLDLYRFFFEWGFNGSPTRSLQRLVVSLVNSTFQWLRLTENRLLSYQAKNH
ncbi:MAG: glycosyltransferase family 2 protein [Bdellovibrionales bacterium]